MNKLRLAVAALALAAATPVVWADNAIQAINSTQQAGAQVVRIEMSEPLAAVPQGFVVQTPPRIAVDLPGVSNAVGRNPIEINQGNLRSVNLAQAGDRTRLVFNLRQASTYRAQLDGKALVVVVEPTEAASISPPATPVTAGHAIEAGAAEIGRAHV